MAQWYRFPGRKKADRDTVRQEVPAVAADTVTVAGDEVFECLEPEGPAEFVYDIPEVISASVLLPLAASTNPSSNFLEFYCGALLAARDLGSQGVKLDLGVFDVSDPGGAPTMWNLGNSDVILGPVAPRDILTQLGMCPENRYIISPLDQRAATLTDTLRVIHATSSTENQIDDMVDWVIQERQPGGTVVVVCNSDEDMPQSGQYLLKRLDEKGVDYRLVSYGILQGLKILDNFESAIGSVGSIQILVASENEAFVGDVVRNVGLLKFRGKDVLLYSTSRIRSFEAIDTETFFSIGLRVSSTYWVDYDSPEVKRFVMAYRALFGAEPGNFAFSGYDTLSYFVRLCSVYGRNWRDKIHEYPARGLQTNFSFEDSDSVGRCNKAVRRTVYNPDFTITLLN